MRTNIRIKLYRTFLVFYLVFNFVLYGQYNFVVNGDFEQYSSCPINFSIPGPFGDQVKNCYGWSIPTAATSDYFNECDGSETVGVPNNIFGYQFAHSGVAYCGFLCYYYFGNLYWHEYLRGRIYPPLEAGKSYKVSFYLSLANMNSDYSASKIGAYLSQDSIFRLDSNPFNEIPQIINPTNNFIVDTTSWVLISDFYIANGNERFITLGWWGDTVDFDTLRIQHTSNIISSYYLIDDVSIVDTGLHIIVPNIISPNNDGLNDFWFPSGFKILKMDIDIYNRWGELVFEGDEDNFTWDGKCGNQPCSAGTYFYAINATGTDNKNIQKRGFIQLFD